MHGAGCSLLIFFFLIEHCSEQSFQYRLSQAIECGLLLTQMMCSRLSDYECTTIIYMFNVYFLVSLLKKQEFSETEFLRSKLYYDDNFPSLVFSLHFHSLLQLIDSKQRTDESSFEIFNENTNKKKQKLNVNENEKQVTRNER